MAPWIPLHGFPTFDLDSKLNTNALFGMRRISKFIPIWPGPQKG